MTAKTIGLIGGMSWESTALYYKLINQEVSRRLGELHSASILMYSYDFEPIKVLQYAERWDLAGDDLARTAQRLEAGGADCVLIGTNTMHIVADKVAGSISVPLLHIADCTADRIIEAGMKSVALLGTKFTMEKDFYVGHLRARGLNVIVPDTYGRDLVNRVIYDELCRGQVFDGSRQAYVDEISALGLRGAEAVILGCTEIGMLIDDDNSPLPTFDTTAIHAAAAAAFCTGRGLPLAKCPLSTHSGH
jgi:aspartate racemase